MKLVEKTYARFAALMESAINHGLDEYITKEELNMFYGLVSDFLCCFDFCKCKVTFDENKDKILIYMCGDKENDVYYIYISRDIMYIEFLQHDPNNPPNPKNMTLYEKLCNLFGIDLTFDPLGNLDFSFNIKQKYDTEQNRHEIPTDFFI